MEEIKEHDQNGNLLHYRDSYGVEWWREYDENNKLISIRNNNA